MITMNKPQEQKTKLGSMKKNKTIKKIIKKAGIASIPLVILVISLLGFINTINMSASDKVLSENLTDSENTELIEYTKEKANQLSVNFKDYYGTDKMFGLEYQYILAYVKYATSAKDNKTGSEGLNTVQILKNEIDTATEILRPKFEYKTDKIITIRQYTVKTNGVEEVKTDKKEEDAYFLTSVKTIKTSYAISYETKTEATQENEVKITITKPVIAKMNQTDKDWDNFKNIIASEYKEENVNDATEVILASAASYVNDNVTEDMIYTGGGSGGTVTGEKFTGSQSEFVEKVAPKAVEDYKKYKILPSITIAQAILESGFGDSKLAQKANNLFGIKSFGWKGPTIDMLTKEYREDKTSYYVMATFRAYNSWDDSIEDHSKVLMQSNFTAVRNATDYRTAAIALKTGGYATDPVYPSLVTSIIEQYGLDKYDK